MTEVATLSTGRVASRLPSGTIEPEHGLRRYDNKCFKCRCAICCEARRAYDGARYQARRAEVLVRVATYRAANLERLREYDRRRYQRPERQREAIERSRAWYRDNTKRAAERLRAYRQSEQGRTIHVLSSHRRRSTKIGFATPAQVAARMAYFGNRCAYCRGPFEHIDHVKPLSKGGSLWPSNLRPSCQECNLRKGVLSLSAFLQRG